MLGSTHCPVCIPVQVTIIQPIVGFRPDYRLKAYRRSSQLLQQKLLSFDVALFQHYAQITLTR